VSRMSKPVQCFANGHPGDWEAICVDFDLAVQGSSFEEVQALLHDAIASYVQCAGAEAPETASRLLRRRAPALVHLRLVLSYLFHTVFKRENDTYRAGFDVPCPG